MPKMRLRQQEWEAPAGITVRDAIRHVGLDPEAHLATVDGRLVHEETILKADDTVRLVAVISGGVA